jgi:hypothetical protein
MASTLSYTGKLVVLTCWCGMAHAVPSGLREYQLRCHDNGERVPDIYCPLGHAHVPSGERAVTIERQARLQAEARLTALSDQLTAAEREAKRIAKRAKQGVCPCCHRSFVKVKAHMDRMHPTYAGT